jgi:hypothetical protein
MVSHFAQTPINALDDPFKAHIVSIMLKKSFSKNQVLIVLSDDTNLGSVKSLDRNKIQISRKKIQSCKAAMKRSSRLIQWLFAISSFLWKHKWPKRQLKPQFKWNSFLFIMSASCAPLFNSPERAEHIISPKSHIYFSNLTLLFL